ncbi:MAG: hypothetical protein RL154_302 [Pseudomonadota bacterium]|jgi:hypothetical protein
MATDNNHNSYFDIGGKSNGSNDHSSYFDTGKSDHNGNYFDIGGSNNSNRMSDMQDKQRRLALKNDTKRRSNEAIAAIRNLVTARISAQQYGNVELDLNIREYASMYYRNYIAKPLATYVLFAMPAALAVGFMQYAGLSIAAIIGFLLFSAMPSLYLNLTIMQNERKIEKFIVSRILFGNGWQSGFIFCYVVLALMALITAFWPLPKLALFEPIYPLINFIAISAKTQIYAWELTRIIVIELSLFAILIWSIVFAVIRRTQSELNLGELINEYLQKTQKQEKTEFVPSAKKENPKDIENQSEIEKNSSKTMDYQTNFEKSGG